MLLLSHSVVSNSSETPWTVTHKAPLSMEFSRQEYWSGFPFPPPGDFPDPGIKLASPALAGGSLPLSHQGSPLRALMIFQKISEFYTLKMWLETVR